MPFKIDPADPALKPHPGAAEPTPAPVESTKPLAPEVDMESLNARLYSANNKIAGWRKKLKKEQEKLHPNENTLAQAQANLDEWLAKRDAVKAEIEAAKKTPIPEPGDVPAKPTPELPEHVTPPTPAAPAESFVQPKAAAYDVSILKEENMDVLTSDVEQKLRAETETWPEAERIEEDIIGRLETGTEDIGLVEMRTPEGELRGLALFQKQNLGATFGSRFDVAHLRLKYPDDVEGALRMVTSLAKLAERDNLRLEIGTWPLSPEVHAALEARGFKFEKGLGRLRMIPDRYKQEFHLANEVEPSLAGIEVEDTVSVGAGAALSQQDLQLIKKLQLDTFPPPKGEASQKILGDAESTEELYKTGTGEGEHWLDERLPVHTEIFKSHFTGKVPPPEGEKFAYLSAGGGAAGKGSVRFDYHGAEVSINDMAKLEAQGKLTDTIYIDSDAIKKMLPEYQAAVESGDIYAAYMVHEESSYLAKQIALRARAEGYSVIIDSTGSSGKFLKNITDLKSEGYNVQVSMVSIQTNEAMSRSLARSRRGRRLFPANSRLGPRRRRRLSRLARRNYLQSIKRS